LINNSKVTIPYPVILKISTLDSKTFHDEASKKFILCLRELIEKVDDQLYEKPAWQIWEIFGAYFHALRINALLILGFDTVKIGELFDGSLLKVSDNIALKLRPMEVICSKEEYSEDLGPIIHDSDNIEDSRNWIEEGLVVLNAVSGEGIDIYFSLANKNGKHVIITDQRKRDSNKLGTTSITKLLSKARITPNIPDAVVYPCIFSVFAYPAINMINIPDKSIIVTSKESEEYFASLWYHPAASPYIHINDTTASHLANFLTGAKKFTVAKEIVGSKRKFQDFDDLDRERQVILKRHKIKNVDWYNKSLARSFFVNYA
jgi:hypothetical protein